MVLQLVTKIRLHLIRVGLGKKFIVSLVALVFVLTSGVFYSFTSAEESVVQNNDQTIQGNGPFPSPEAAEMQPSTTNPMLLKEVNERIVVGTVISNETASVYPRREGIVKDVLVDIGDTVQQGQVIARLLPPGVEGQGAALIAEKSALLHQAQLDAKNSQAVADSNLQAARQELEEKMTIYQNTLNKKSAMVTQAKTVATTTVDNEEAKIASAQQVVVNETYALKQVVQETIAAINHGRLTAERAILGGSTPPNDSPLQAVPFNVGLLASSDMRNRIMYDANALIKSETELSSMADEQKISKVFDVAQEADELINNSITLTRGTIPNDSLSSSDINDLLRELNDIHTGFLDLRERLQNAQNDLEIAEKKLSEAESEKEKNTEAAEKDLHVVAATQNADLQGFGAEIKTFEQKIELLKAEQRQTVDRDKSEVRVAGAMLQQELATNGNADIRSPFSGTISKRLINVGEMVQPGMVSFELVNVPTTLAKKAKREIQFGLPEDLEKALKVGDTVDFFLPTDEKTIAQAKVTRKSPQVDSETRLFTVQAKLDDALVIAHNTRVRVRISLGEQQVYHIPTAAIKREENNNFLWIMTPDLKEPQQLTVTVLNEDGEFAEITGELNEQTMILLNSPEPSSEAKQPTP